MVNLWLVPHTQHVTCFTGGSGDALMLTAVKLIDLLVRAAQTLFGQNDAPATARAALWFAVLCSIAVTLAAGVLLLVLAVAWLEHRGAQWM